MRAFAAPKGYLALGDARDALTREMHAGVPPSDKVEEHRRAGFDVGDHDQTMSAVHVLRHAIGSGELGIYADLSSRENPRRLDRELREAARHPSDGAVMTFVYIGRPSTETEPFGLSRSDVKELIHDPLCIDEEEFRAWLKRERQKKDWPCHHAVSGAPRRRPGRPSKWEKVIEVLEELVAQGELVPGVPVKEAHFLVQQARSWPEGLSAETVRRALRDTRL
jgi:hypothetical protein